MGAVRVVSGRVSERFRALMRMGEERRHGAAELHDENAEARKLGM